MLANVIPLSVELSWVPIIISSALVAILVVLWVATNKLPLALIVILLLLSTLNSILLLAVAPSVSALIVIVPLSAMILPSELPEDLENQQIQKNYYLLP